MFRTALRTSAGAAFRQRSVARRYASSHSKQPAGDATWAMGSAAVFGSITAYLLMSGGAPAEAAVHSTSHMKIADATEKDVTPEDAPTLVSLAVGVAASGEMGPNEGPRLFLRRYRSTLLLNPSTRDPVVRSTVSR